MNDLDQKRKELLEKIEKQDFYVYGPAGMGVDTTKLLEVLNEALTEYGDASAYDILKRINTEVVQQSDNYLGMANNLMYWIRNELKKIEK